MTWQFEWNWLGYLWAFLVGFPLAYGFALAFAEGRAAAKGNMPSGTGNGAGIMVVIAIGATPMLALLTVFVWDWRTALWLTGGAVALGALDVGLRGGVELGLRRLERAKTDKWWRAHQLQQGELRGRNAVCEFDAATDDGNDDQEYAVVLGEYLSSQAEEGRVALQARLGEDPALHGVMLRTIREMSGLISRAGLRDQDAEYAAIAGHLLERAQDDSPEVRAMRLHYLENAGRLDSLQDGRAARELFRKRMQAFRATYLEQHSLLET